MRFLIFFSLILVLILGCHNPNSNSSNAVVSQPIETMGAKELVPQSVKDYLSKNLAGWTIPDTSDYIKAWWSFYDKNQIPFFVTSDFNDDHVSDYAMILKNSKSIRLVILTATGNSYTLWMADDFNEAFGGKDIQYGLVIEPPGRTDCIIDNKEQSLVLESNGIALMALEQKCKIYYWHSGHYKTFRVTSKPADFMVK
jgi:hypothetical protein